jgi:hypothetical protein
MYSTCGAGIVKQQACINVTMSVSSFVPAKHEVCSMLSKGCVAPRNNVSFVGSGGFYSIFQHTDGNRLHSMACGACCGGQHS